MGEVVPFPRPELTQEEIRLLAAEAEVLIEDTEKALRVAKGIRLYYLNMLGMVNLDGQDD